MKYILEFADIYLRSANGTKGKGKNISRGSFLSLKQKGADNLDLPFNEIVNLGFSVFVAVFLLTKLDSTLKALNETINSFKSVIIELRNANRQNIDEQKEQTQLLRDHDSKLDKLKNQISNLDGR